MTRWSRLLVAAGLLAAGPAAAQDATLAPGTRFSAVRVDVGPLYARGLDVFADRVRADLQAALDQAFADRIGGRGPSLVVRVTGLSLNPYAGSENGRGRGGNGTNTDYLDGEALVVGPRGEVLLRHPQLSATPASFGGAWYDPASESRRVVAITQHYAQWLRRNLGGD
ncbi:hypothetical protein [Methylobacterium oryzihabitans]|uniref:DUF3016 domain-containing protein n=1 Tax=Methylobacterium oryzihabitans TaxID=2499852 RepID=A0A437NWP2_9HYPH|nr:hypothetical protein [Methylobacterium oryzihabitans]RVU14436.1 hypothetical protein EOE48_22945 [Methylobacterium oryzihabitans]